MIVGIPREMYPGERRVALVPAALKPLVKAGWSVLVEAEAGDAAGFPDKLYEDAGAQIASSREKVFAEADAILQVRALGANLDGWKSDLSLLRSGQTLIATAEPLSNPEPAAAVARRGVIAFALELLPRITRAQSMDVLSSQANLAGYKAVLMAADALPKIFPMMMTAAGTITPSRVFVVGAGVAGLQAIATAKRLGAVVSAYDVRPAVKEQVESVGGRFVQLDLLQEGAAGSGGYASAMTPEFYAKQAELMSSVVEESDVVITTAAIPGQKAPILITREMVEKMQPGSIVVDLAAERGGNCELTVPGQTVVHCGVTVMGPLNIPSSVAHHASQLFSKNISTFLLHLTKDGKVVVDTEDEITRETLITQGGEVVNKRLRDLLELPRIVEKPDPTQENRLDAAPPVATAA